MLIILHYVLYSKIIRYNNSLARCGKQLGTL